MEKMRKYMAVAEALRDQILAGKYSPGSTFPSVKMLCRRFGVSHLTAVKAIETLKNMGLVRTKNGVGTFVVRKVTKIGLIVPMMEQVEIFPLMCQEISRCCQKIGVGVDFASMSSTSSRKLQSDIVSTAKQMVADGVAGIIFHPVDFVEDAAKINSNVLNVFVSAGVSVVILDADLEVEAQDHRFDFVGVDSFEIGRFAAKHVIERGARRLVFVAWDVMCDNVRRRLDGVISTVSQNPGTRIVGTYRWCGNEQTIAKAWKKVRPDAIVCSSDSVAAKVLKMLTKVGMRCPQDVFVTGVNDVSLASLVSPTLTTLHQHCESIARTALETLLWRVENPDADKRRIMIAADLVIRESTTREG